MKFSDYESSLFECEECKKIFSFTLMDAQERCPFCNSYHTRFYEETNVTWWDVHEDEYMERNLND